jgi:flagellar biosynthesis/type III secretory pathway chaperone
METLKAAAIAQSLTTLLQQYNDLQMILKQESECLQATVAETLLDITQAKYQVLNEILLTKQALQTTLDMNKDEPIEGKLVEAINLLAVSGEVNLGGLWQQLHTQVEACQKLNAINGRTIYSSLDITQKMLQVLTHQDAKVEVYDNLGVMS